MDTTPAQELDFIDMLLLESFNSAPPAGVNPASVRQDSMDLVGGGDSTTDSGWSSGSSTCGSGYGSPPPPLVPALEPPTRKPESRRVASCISARRRRWSEARLLQELAETLACTPEEAKHLDKMTTLRLSISTLRLRCVLQALDKRSGSSDLDHLEMGVGLGLNVETMENAALGDGFLLVLSIPLGDVIHVSARVANSLGYTPSEIIGRNLYEFCNSADQDDVHNLLEAPSASNARIRHSTMVRLKCSPRRRRDEYTVRADRYKVFHVSGKFYEDDEADNGGFFLGVASPVPHPADSRVGLWPFLSQHIFTTVHMLDMTYVNADPSFGRFFGYEPEDFIGIRCFEFVHPEDIMGDTVQMRSLYEKGQAQTSHFRFLMKGGGHAWICSQKTILNSNGLISSRNRAIVVCRCFVLGVERGDEIVSYIQLPKAQRQIQQKSHATSEHQISIKEEPVQKVQMLNVLTPPPSCEDCRSVEEETSTSSSLLDGDVDLNELEEYFESHSVERQQINDHDARFQDNLPPLGAVGQEASASGQNFDFQGLSRFSEALDSFFTLNVNTPRPYQYPYTDSEDSSVCGSLSPPPITTMPTVLGKRAHGQWEQQPEEWQGEMTTNSIFADLMTDQTQVKSVMPINEKKSKAYEF